jgi:hypothetical protein
MKITEIVLQLNGFKCKDGVWSKIYFIFDRDDVYERIIKTLHLEEWKNGWDVEISECYRNELKPTLVNICTLKNFKQLQDLYYIISNERLLTI